MYFVAFRMYNPSRGGVRGGADQFTWESVKTDKHRENYLGTINFNVTALNNFTCFWVYFMLLKTVSHSKQFFFFFSYVKVLTIYLKNM